MTDGDVYTIIIQWMIKSASNKQYRLFLDDVLKGVQGKRFIEQHNQPRYKAIVAGFGGLFLFSIVEYRKMAKELIITGDILYEQKHN